MPSIKFERWIFVEEQQIWNRNVPIDLLLDFFNRKLNFLIIVKRRDDNSILSTIVQKFLVAIHIDVKAVDAADSGSEIWFHLFGEFQKIFFAEIILVKRI